MQITFNTGRAYSDNGQEIKATFSGGFAYFTDYARMIDGKIALQPSDQHNAETIMYYYDRSKYTYWHGNHAAI